MPKSTRPRHGFTLIELLVVIASVAASTAHAATFTVDVTSDMPDANPGDGVAEDENGDTTLRAAIEESNALSGADVVQFNAGLANSTIYISEDTLSITDHLTIAGLGETLLCVDGVFLIDMIPLIEIASGVTVDISDLKIDNAPDRAILNRGTLAVTDSRIEDASGGGILNVNGALGVDGATFSNCAAIEGGAVSTSGGTVDLTDTVCDLNWADHDGASLYNNDGTVVISGCQFTRGFATGKGGAIYSIGMSADVDIMDSTFTGNIATIQGGAIFNDGSMEISDETYIEENGAMEKGGGILIYCCGSLKISGSFVRYNSVDEDDEEWQGGGIFSFGSLAVIGSTISNNTPDDIKYGSCPCP